LVEEVRMRRMGLWPCCTVALVIAAAGCVKDKDGPGGLEFGAVRLEDEPLPAVLTLPRGVADTANDVGYVANTSGGIDAVSLGSGATLWSTDAAAYPLWLHDSRLVARPKGEKNLLRLIVLDVPKQGAVVLQTDPLTLPEWACVGLERGRSFACRGRFEDDGHFVLHWEARSWPLGKMAEDTRKPRHASGFARFDLESGKVDAVPEGDAPRVLAAQLPESLAKDFSGALAAARLAFLTPSIPMWELHHDGKHLLRVGDRLIFPEGITASGRGKLLLHSFDAVTGQAAEPKLLLETPPFDAEKHLATGKVAPGEIPSGWGSFDAMVCYEVGVVLARGYPLESPLPADAWEAFSATTGKRLGRVTMTPGQEYTLAGRRAYVLVPSGRDLSSEWDHKYPRSLRAVDAASGKLLWERPVAEYHSLHAPHWYRSPD
jgi:hypothetical protein